MQTARLFPDLTEKRLDAPPARRFASGAPLPVRLIAGMLLASVCTYPLSVSAGQTTAESNQQSAINRSNEYIFANAFQGAGEQTIQTVRQTVPEESLELLTDRRTIRHLQELQEQIRRRAMPSVRDALLPLQQQDPGLMVPQEADSDDSGAVWEPLWRRLFRDLHQLPTESLNEWRRQDSQSAQGELVKAVRSLQPDQLIAVIHRFPVTDAASQAHLIIARQHLDQGNDLAAISWLQPLTQQGVPSRWRSIAERTLSQLTRLVLVKPTSTLDPGPSSAKQLRDPDSEKGSEPELPINTRWEHAPLLPPAVRDAIDRLTAGAAVSRVVPWTNWVPAIDEARVYARTMRGVSAVSLRDGAAAWTWMSSRRLDVALMAAGRGFATVPAPPGAEERNSFASLDRSPISNLLNRNAVIGRITKDRERLFLVEDYSVSDTFQSSTPFMMRGVPRAATPISELIALDLKSGRRVWSVGGPPIEENFGNELTKCWIAGPPTVDGYQLYCVVEQAETISLVCLAAETGTVLWKTPLAFPTAPLAQDVTRRMTAAQPVARQGLVCTTSTTGWMFGVDSLTRTVIWACRTKNPDAADDVRAMRGRVLVMAPAPSLSQSWRCEAPLLFGSQLVVFPETAGQLMILDALTGRETTHLTTDTQHVMCLYADDQRIVTAGPRSFEAFDISTGMSLWRTSLPVTAAVPTGSAVQLDGRLIIPMTDGSLILMSLDRGALLDSRLDVRLPPLWGNLYAVPAAKGIITTQPKQQQALPSGSSSRSPDLIVYSPQQIAMISKDAVATDGRRIDRAELMVRQGRPEEALQLLDELNPNDTNSERSRLLRFRSLAGILARDCGPHELTRPKPGPGGHREPTADRRNINDARRSEMTQTLRDLARAPSEMAVVAMFEIDSLLAEDLPNENRKVAAERIIRLLAGDATLLQEDVDVLAESDSQSAGTGPGLPDVTTLNAARRLSSSSVTAQLPLRTWLLAKLDGLAEESAEATRAPDWLWLQARLNELPDETLCGLQTPAAVPALLARVNKRIHAGEFTEASLHLLLQADRLTGRERGADIGAASSSAVADFPSGANGRETVHQTLNNYLEEATATSVVIADRSDESWKRARAELLSVVAAEVANHDSKMPTESSIDDAPAADSVATSVSVTRPLAEILDQRWRSWPDRPYSAIPVYQSMIMRNPDFAASSPHPEDPFLSVYEWQFQRSPSLLKATTAVSDVAEVWYIPGNYSELVGSGGASTTISRHGSVIVAVSAQAVIGMSALERRVLWVRRMPTTSGQVYSMSQRKGLFRDFTIGDVSQVENVLRSEMAASGSFRIVGSSPRHLCVQSAFQLEMLDLLSGETLWSRHSDSGVEHAIATSNAVLTLSLFPNRVAAYDPATGAAKATEVSAETLRHALAASNDGLVILQPAIRDGETRVIEWVDALSGRSERRIELTGVRLFQQPDATTLIGFSSGSFTVIDLHTGETQEYPLDFAALLDDTKNGSASTPSVERSDLQKSRVDTAAEPLSDAQLARFSVWTDPVNYYVTASSAAVLNGRMPRLAGRDLMSLGGRIAAIDRRSGALRWTTDSTSAMHVSFDQPTAPVLLLLSTDDNGNAMPNLPGFPAQPGTSALMIRGIHKTSGTELFAHRLQSRFFVTFVRLSSGSSEGRNIDVEAYGSRIRFVASDRDKSNGQPPGKSPP